MQGEELKNFNQINDLERICRIIERQNLFYLKHLERTLKVKTQVCSERKNRACGACAASGVAR